MEITSKNKATALLKSLIRTSQGIIKSKKIYEDKLIEVQQLEKDDFIGLKLTEEQEETMKSKKGFELIVKFLEDTIKNNNLEMISNEDEFVKLCVECIFLEKKEVKEKKVDAELNAGVSAGVKAEDKKVEKKVQKKVEKKVAKVEKKVEIEVEIENKNEEEEIEGVSNVRIPYAWKSKQFFEGGERERKRDAEKKNHIPAKEYRGFHDKKNAYK